MVLASLSDVYCGEHLVPDIYLCVDVRVGAVEMARWRVGLPVSSYLEQALRKHAYSNILKITPTKTQSLQIKILIFFFHISAQNIDYGIR